MRPAFRPASRHGRYPFASAFTLVSAVVISLACQCGPPDDAWQWDTGTTWWDTGGGTTGPVGFTVDDDATISLMGTGAVQTFTVRTTLTARCLEEVPDYSWGYPTGWMVVGWTLTDASPTDTGGAPDTAGADTAMDTGTTDTGTTDTGTTDTGTTDTGTTDTGTSPTDTGDTGDSGGGEDTGSGRTRVSVSVVRADGGYTEDARTSLATGSSGSDSLTDDRPYTACVRDEACETTWLVTLTLEEGSVVTGTLDAHARIRVCSSGDSEASDITVGIE